ncbi:cytochrome c family protein [Thermotomaculum hydrothermale]|uniref:Cytochrome c family protein n=1 Tax=Thermotomaculum hydrothermale TaxID=981385 RepID=A0A7R6PNS0_9BACT|nr:GSU2203 family decaheme c-type cytochrome [Thermotomaculum hydrothermale]BBB33023.1 cytochrome c family protein [Thermotomaculum hydrothermale]
MRRLTLICLVVGFVLFFPSLAISADKGFVGVDTCSGCHEDVVTAFDKSFHATYFKKGDQFKCEACHGPGEQHADEEDPSLIYGPSNNKFKLEKQCLKCHSNVLHGLKEKHVIEYGVGCTDCHKVHQPAFKGSLVKEENKLCISCHKKERAQFLLPSHHPVVKEGKMKCIDCHKFDGSEENKLDERVNAKCLSCHPQYRGPFVFEHAPVAENCTICHNPHGAVADNLLKKNEPFLCLQCHQMHFHATLPGYEGTSTEPNHPDRVVRSDRQSFKRAFTTKCTQCHTRVHGTDLPSEGLSGQGKALTR